MIVLEYIKPIVTGVRKAGLKRSDELMKGVGWIGPWKPSPATLRFKRFTGYYLDKETKMRYDKKEYEKWYSDF